MIRNSFIVVAFCFGLLVGFFLANGIRHEGGGADVYQKHNLDGRNTRVSAVRSPINTFNVINLSKYDAVALSSMELNMAGIDPVQLIEGVSKLEACSRTDALVYAYFREWSKFDHLGALTYAKTQINASMCVPAVLEGWASVDPQSAFEWVASNAPDDISRSLNLVVGKMAAIEPDYFIANLDKIPYDIVQNNLPTLVDQFIVDGKREDLFNWVDSLSDSDPLKADVYVTIMNSWGAKNMDEVWEVLNGISSDGVRSSAITGFVNASTHTNPNQIYKWVEDNLINDPSQEYHLNSVIETWPETDLNGYVSWLSRLDQAALTDRMILSLVSRTRDSDLLLTSEWISKLKESGVRDQMTRDFVNQMDVGRLEIVSKSSNIEISGAAQNRLDKIDVR